MRNGVVQTAGAVTLVSETDGHKIETTVSGAVTTYVTKDADGLVLARQTSEVQGLGTPDRAGLEDALRHLIWRNIATIAYAASEQLGAQIFLGNFDISGVPSLRESRWMKC